MAKWADTTGVVSELVDTVTVSVLLTVAGLTAPCTDALRVSPGLTVRLPKTTNVNVVDVDGLAAPTTVAAFEAVNAVPDNRLKSVPEENPRVTGLPALPDNPPVAEVANTTV